MKKGLLEFTRENKIEFVDLKFCDLRGILRHISFPIERLEKVLAQGIGVDGSSIGFACVEHSDLVIKPDDTFYFLDPFYEFPTLSLFGDLYLADGKTLHPLFPRNILKKAVNSIKKFADEMTLLAEHEFYVFTEVDYSLKEDTSSFFVISEETQPETMVYNAYHIAPPADKFYGFRTTVLHTLKKIGVKLKYHHHEVGRYAQMEIETDFIPLPQAADFIVLFKYFVKNIAKKYNLWVTFMPKPIRNEAGSGLHLHIKLFKDGVNLFASKNDISDTCRYCIGGIVKNARALCALTNPSTNSYRRLNGGQEAPQEIFYSVANRNASIRIPGYIRDAEDRRFEYRIPDSTMNPYLGIAGIIAACIEGMEEKINPDQIKRKKVPFSLKEALESLKTDHEFLLKFNIFSEEFIPLWIRIKEKEIEEIESYPTPADYVYYFNI